MSSTPAKQPNFIFILADDLGFADLSCYGREDYQTPAIDALAEQGMRFTHGYANSAVCTATRVALMTGRYQYRLPIGLEEPLQGRDIGLQGAHPTLPSLLRDCGYHTALVGKWHWGNCPNIVRSKAALTNSGAFAAAAWIISPMNYTARMICGTARPILSGQDI